MNTDWRQILDFDIAIKMFLIAPTFQFTIETEKQFTNDLLFALDFIYLSALNSKYLYFKNKKQKNLFFSSN